jgi:hypothetical protein
MFSILHFIEAKARLAESIKTIEMMGGEEDCQPMILGQRDFLLLEVEYYRDEIKTFVIGALFFAIVCVIVLKYYF